MKSNESRAELHELLAELVESNLSETQWRRLKQLIATDIEARRIYRRVLMAESLLERFQVDVNAPTDIAPVDKGNRNRFASARHFLRRGYDWIVHPTPLSFTVATIVVVLLTTAMAFVAVPIHRQWTAGAPEPGSVAPILIATLSGVQNAVWDEGQIGQHHGASLVAGHEIRLKSGVIEVTFYKGAKVQFKGPVKAILQNDNAAQLLSGKLVAHVPKSAVGFAVETPTATIVDLGTEFGAEVQDGSVETQVFVGEVMIQQPGNKGVSTAGGVRVGAGQAVRVEATGKVKPAPFTSRSSFLPCVGFNNLALGKPIIDVSASWPGPPKPVDGRYVAGHVVDGKVDDSNGSYWIGRYSTPGEYFTLDLRSQYRIERIELLPTHNGVANTFGTEKFEIWASDAVDDKQQLVKPQLIASGSLPNASGTGADLPVVVLSEADGNLTPLNARYLRFDAKTYYGHGCGLNEIRISAALSERSQSAPSTTSRQ